MLVFGYLGETGAVAAINSTTGFVGGMLCWGTNVKRNMVWRSSSSECWI